MNLARDPYLTDPAAIDLICHVADVLDEVEQLIATGRVHHGRRVLGKARFLIDCFLESSFNEHYRGSPPRDACE